VAQLLSAQRYYLPYNIKEAYEQKQTRSFDGKPGSSYWQNKSFYDIKAKFNPVTGKLTGSEKILYVNNSPDSLYYLVVRLNHDILKKGGVRDEEFSPEYVFDGVGINSFTINGVEYNNSARSFFQQNGTNLFVGLNYFISQGDTLNVYIEWESTLPPGHAHRFGKYGENNWFVAYWYPQIAVYDDINGWVRGNYTGQHEFYNDFNDFSVELTVPTGYMVWGTGDWQNAEAILSADVFKKYNRAIQSDEIIKVVSEEDWKHKKVFKKQKKMVYKYSAEQLTDVAFAVSDNYLWDAGSVVTDSSDMKRTTIHSVYPVEAKHFDHVAEKSLSAVAHFSHHSFKIPYPYSHFTIFNGGGGMEFPMITNMHDRGVIENTFTAMHELFHAYFPFQTGLNEREYAWMDEGLTTYLTLETEAVINDVMDYSLQRIFDTYNYFSGTSGETPLFTPSHQTRGHNYQHHAYFRSATAFALLEHYLGRETFRGAVRDFYKTWEYKHPTGYDFIFSLEKYSNEDLSWFVKPWFFGSGWADLAIGEVTDMGDSIKVSIDNIGGFPVPVALKIIPENEDSYTLKYSAKVWKEQTRFYIYIPSVKALKRLEIGGYDIPDKDPENNYYFFNE
jgi:hypothetical protein